MTLQYDGVRPVVEGTLEGDTWTTTAVNYWEGPTYYSPLASRYLPNGGGGYNYLADGLGSTRQLMRNSDHAITDTYAYDAFGNTLASTGSTDNPYRYVGGLGYRASGGEMRQLGAREYLPGVGVFLQADPVRDTPAFSYAYAKQAPLSQVDPSGESPAMIVTKKACVEACVQILGPRCRVACQQFCAKFKGKSCNAFFSWCKHIARHGGSNNHKWATYCMMIYDMICLGE